MNSHQDKKIKLMNAQAVNDGATTNMAHASSGAGKTLGDDILYLVAKQCDTPKDVFHLMMCCSKDMHPHFKGELIRTDIAWDVDEDEPEPLVQRAPRPGKSYLCFAIEKGYARDIKRIVVEAVRAGNAAYIDGISYKSDISKEMSPLHVAVMNGDLGTCELLIHAGCSPNVKYRPEKPTALINCYSGNHARCRCPSHTCKYALTMAIELGHNAIVNLLLDHPDLDFFPDGKTPFHAAVEKQNYPLIKRLLDDRKLNLGPNSTTTGDSFPNYVRPIHIVAGAPGDSGAAIIHFLVSRGARINVIDFSGRSPLSLAIMSRNKTHTLALLGLGAKFRGDFGMLSHDDKLWYKPIAKEFGYSGLY